MEQTEPLILSMSPADLNVIARAMEKNVAALQKEYTDLEHRAVVLKQEIDVQEAMLSIMQAKLLGK